jgi:hypothetical protein
VYAQLDLQVIPKKFQEEETLSNFYELWSLELLCEKQPPKKK